MSTMKPNTEGRGGRLGSWVNAAILVFAMTACVVLLVIVSTRTAQKIDVTATRQHQLSPRTAAALKNLDRTLTLVVAADLGSLDKVTKQRTLDVLEKFDSASPRLKVRLIDTTRTEGLAEYDAVLRDLAVKDKPQIDAATGVVKQSAAKAEALAGDLRVYQERLLKQKDQPGVNASFLTSRAAMLRVLAEDLSKGAAAALAQLAQNDSMLPLPPIDKARAELNKPVTDAAAELTELHRLFSDTKLSATATAAEKAVAGQLLVGLAELRDGSAQLAGALGDVNLLPRLLRVARALQSRRAALLIDEGAVSGSGVGMLGIDVDQLLGVGEEHADLRAHTEDVITGAILALTSGVRPVVCLVHGAPVRLAPMDFAGFRRMREQLSMGGIDMVEWPVALDREMPAAAAGHDPKRPVVFVTVTATGRAQDRAAGIQAFTSALDQLVASGRSVLLSVNLSQTPMNGAPDPFVECLKPLGVTVDSGRPVLHDEQAANRRVVSPFVDIVEPGGSHPIADAVGGLKTRFMWPMSIDVSKTTPGLVARPIIVLPAGAGVWAESEWLEFYRGVEQSKGDYTLIANPPSKDSQRDDAGTSAGWVLAAALERSERDIPRQRVVVVGSNGWFVDGFTNQQSVVDGKQVPAWPGNLQLLESSVHWLAFQDDQIGRGATASQVSLIPPLSAGKLGWLRALLIGVLPALVLVLGVLYRLVRH
jgi:hypothetical protein